jgi:hypothetical protein
VREVAGLDALAGPRQWLAARVRLSRELGEYDVVNVHNFPATIWAGANGKSAVRRIWYCEEPPRHLHEGLMRPVWAGRETDWQRGNGSAPPVPASGGLGEAWALGRLRFWGRTHRLSAKLEPAWSRAYLGACLALQRAAVSRMSRIAANSAHTAGLVEAAYNRQAAVCWLGVPEPARGGPEAEEGFEYDVLIIASDSPIKNLRGALEALALLRNRGGCRMERCAVIGAPRSAPALVKELGLEKVATHVPRVSERELGGLYDRARVVLYVPFDEPFGLVAVEAAMHGRPCVASREGGCLETVLEGETGLLAEPANPQEIADKLEALLRDEGLARSLGRAARAWAREVFSVEAFVRRFESLLADGQASAEMNGGLSCESWR